MCSSFTVVTIVYSKCKKKTDLLNFVLMINALKVGHLNYFRVILVYNIVSSEETNGYIFLLLLRRRANVAMAPKGKPQQALYFKTKKK